MNEQMKPYPDYVMKRLLYVGRYYSSFLPGAKASITKERKRYEHLWPGINAEAFKQLDALKISALTA